MGTLAPHLIVFLACIFGGVLASMGGRLLKQGDYQFACVYFALSLITVASMMVHLLIYYLTNKIFDSLMIVRCGM